MTVYPIVTYGDPVLHRRSSRILAFDAALSRLIDDMFESMYAADGVGLAANQIGVDAAVFVMDCPDEDGRPVVAHVVNPILKLPTFGGFVEELEGCLSVPGQHAMISRTASARVTGLDRTGTPIKIATTGTAARCLQHEVAHLQGQVYVDLLPEPERSDVLRAADLA